MMAKPEEHEAELAQLSKDQKEIMSKKTGDAAEKDVKNPKHA